MRGRTIPPLATVAALAALLGCSDSATDLGAGESCVRTAQCGDGLACVAGRCSSDVGELGEMGMVPDAGPDTDGMVMMIDGGGVDSGPVGMDSGPPEVDSGPPEVDSGPPEVDSGPPEVDSGPPEVDSGPPDAGSTTDGG